MHLLLYARSLTHIMLSSQCEVLKDLERDFTEYGSFEKENVAM